MIKVNELYVTPDSKKLVIDVEVLSGEWYEDVYLDYIKIVPHNNFKEQDSSKIFVKNLFPTILSDNLQNALDVEIEEAVKQIKKKYRLIVDKLDLGYDLKNTLFFIYIKTCGIPSPEIPCGEDNETSTLFTYNQKEIKDTALNYIKGITSSCGELNMENKRLFIDFILKHKTLDLLLDTGHLSKAAKEWESFMKNSDTSQCNCNK